MQAAEHIFEGEFADLMDDDVAGTDPGPKSSGSGVQPARIMVCSMNLVQISKLIVSRHRKTMIRTKERWTSMMRTQKEAVSA